MARLVLVVLFLITGAARADGYASQHNCFATIEEAASMEAYRWNGSGNCANGQCRILSYVPTSGATSVMSNNSVLALTVPRCTGSFSTLPSFITPSPWFGSDPGVVSACGNTVSPTGGLVPTSSNTTSSTSVVALTPEQALERYKDGVQLGWGVALAIVVAWALAVLGKAFVL